MEGVGVNCNGQLSIINDIWAIDSDPLR